MLGAGVSDAKHLETPNKRHLHPRTDQSFLDPQSHGVRH